MSDTRGAASSVGLAAAFRHPASGAAMYWSLSADRLDRWPSCDPLIGLKQIHAWFLGMTHNRFSNRGSRSFRINAFITPAVRERIWRADPSCD